MEDAHTQLLSLNNDKNSAFFAVYDGHGGIYRFNFEKINKKHKIISKFKLGPKVAEYAGMHLHQKILSHPSFSEYYFINL
jgi:hypothetical protein